MKPDYNAAIDFLTRFCPEGPWLPTMIWPDAPKSGPKLRSRTFHKGKEQEMGAWIKRHNDAGMGGYFHVNPRLRDLDKKAEKADIEGLSWLHVDVDPEPGQPLEDEQARILARFQDPPKSVPPATVVLFSGGGYQAFWRLGSTMLTQGQEGATTEAERYNRQLELIFDGDNCFNIDRVMRLPGTINWPNEKKRSNGQAPQLAKVISWNDEVYDLHRFTPAPLVNDSFPGLSANRSGTVEISGNIPSISADLSELDPYGISDWHKTVIVQGHHPDDPDKHSSPSEWQWALSCELARQDVPDEIHYAVLMDRDLGISKTIYKKGSGADRYARRQITRAKEAAIDPELLYMNDRYAAIKEWDSSFWVIKEKWDPHLKRQHVIRMSKAAILDAYCNRFVQVPNYSNKGEYVGDVPLAIGKWWMTHKERRTYETVDFCPGVELGADVYNLWQGFACDAIPGDCSLYLDHVLKVICSGNKDNAEWLLNWMARLVQYPAEAGQVAVVLKGPQGAGKGILLDILGRLFGRHYLPVSDPKRITGAFNAHLRDCVLLFADEAFHTADRNNANGALKALITERMSAYEVKGKDVTLGMNYVHLILASNEDWVVPAEIGDRRFFAVNVSAHRKLDFDYFANIVNQIENGGLEALLHFLLTRDVSEFNYREAPKTEALVEQQMHGFDPELMWWQTKLEEGSILPEKTWVERIYTSELVHDYITFSATGKMRGGRAAQTVIGMLLKSYCPGAKKRRAQGKTVLVRGIDGIERKMVGPYYYEFPPIPECREKFEEGTGMKFNWPKIVEVEPPDDPADDGNGEF